MAILSPLIETFHSYTIPTAGPGSDGRTLEHTPWSEYAAVIVGERLPVLAQQLGATADRLLLTAGRLTARVSIIGEQALRETRRRF